ncbi:MAG: HU family DNA-binding protein [bacterium]|nr:HU family DNA-binding protein [bacterium]
MNHRQLVSAIARRFSDLTQRQIEDVLDILAELCRAELAQPGGEIVIRNLGRLTVEVQRIRNAGAVRAQMGSGAPDNLTRLYFRFRPTSELRHEIEQALKEQA